MKLSSSVPASTLAETLRSQLERDIVTNVLKPGTRLDEQEIAERFGMSRTPVREAFRALAATGLVEIRSRQGATVSAIDVASLIEMFEVMAELEGLCARLAARRATPAQRAVLAEIHERLRVAATTADPIEFYEVNREFHEAIYQAAQNEFLADQTRALRNRVGAYRRQVTYLPGRIEATVAEHLEMMEAIFRRDGGSAHSAARDHVSLLGGTLSDFIALLSAPEEAA